MNLDSMTLEKLKKYLQAKTPIEYEIKGNELQVKGLKNSQNIKAYLLDYTHNSKRFICVSHEDGNNGGGRPCNSVREATEEITRIYKILIPETPKVMTTQLALF